MNNVEKKRLCGIFNSKLNEFLNDLIKIFPDDTDFKMYKNAVNLIKIADIKKPLELYNIFVTEEYKKNIEEKNESFFLDHDYKEILNNEMINNVNSNVNNKLVNKLKGYWSDLTDENKEFIWSYFTLFLKINEKVKTVAVQ
tara:strand:- start:30 stop:452 length:423 start_codon:yes stop_codon:yes gene_type:complete